MTQAEQMQEIERLLTAAIALGKTLLLDAPHAYEAVDLARWIRTDMDLFIKSVWSSHS